jgi:hypothetical protein
MSSNDLGEQRAKALKAASQVAVDTIARFSENLDMRSLTDPARQEIAIRVARAVQDAFRAPGDDGKFPGEPHTTLQALEIEAHDYIDRAILAYLADASR